MQRTAILALGLWVAAWAAQAQSMGPGSPPISAETQAALAEAGAGRPDTLSRLADAGRPDAQLYAGIFLVFGVQGFQKDGVRGCGYVASASTVRADAMHTLGECLQYGYGGEKDLEKAVVTFHKAGDMGMAKSRCAEGNILIELGREQARAVKLCREGAEAGDADAQTDTGNFYLQGRFVPRDVSEARAWYEKAAAQGQRNAAFTLGQIYWNGDGVGRDTAKAAQLWRIAYDKGRDDAAFHLGNEAFLRAGRGPTKWDPTELAEARDWYAKAVNTNNSEVAQQARERRELCEQLIGVMKRQKG
jgi:TPR repeat protein